MARAGRKRCWGRGQPAVAYDRVVTQAHLHAAGLWLVGRDAEMERLNAVFDRLPDGGGALMVVGEPGIGKSALLGHVRARAGEWDALVLSRMSQKRSRLLATHNQPIRLERPMAIHLAYAHPDRHRPPQSPILPSGLCYLMTANFRCVGTRDDLVVRRSPA